MLKQMQLPMAGSVDRSGTMRRLKGLSIAPGLGMGYARIMGDILNLGSEVQGIQEYEIDRELERIRVAFEKARQDLEEASRRIETQLSPALADIFHAHELMLKSLQSSQHFEQEVQASLVNAEVAVRRVFQRWQEKFLALRGEAFQQRSDDVADIGRKVLRHLAGCTGNPLLEVPEGSVLIFERLLPSDVVPLSKNRVAAIVVEFLGRGAHAALLARSKSIPTVTGFPGLLEQIWPGEEALVDGDSGEVVLVPDAPTRLHFQERLTHYRSTQARCQGSCRQPARTRDGTSVAVEANVGGFEDVQLALENGADGVGLFRIEELYLTRELPPTEEELLFQLRQITAPLFALHTPHSALRTGMPLTIRLLDIGGDKAVPFLRLAPETNRLLGRRGVRLLREFHQLARTQLAALLHLAQEAPLRVLVPMVTLEEDMQEVRRWVEALCAELGIRHPPALGAMIETPAAALNVAAIARHADFLCVGTNDLAQYTLAAGRDDPAVVRYYQDNHVSVLRLLQLILAEAGTRPLTLCGELAAREEALPHLLAMGFRSLSLSPPSIPAIKEWIRAFRLPGVAGVS